MQLIFFSAHAQAAGLKGLADRTFPLGQRQLGRRLFSYLPSNSCQYFYSLGLVAGPRRFECLTDRLQALADPAASSAFRQRPGLVGACGGLGLQIGGEEQIELPAQLQNIVQPLLFRGGADDRLSPAPGQARCIPREFRILDGDDIGQFGDPRAEPGLIR